MSCDLIKLAQPGVQALHPYQPGKPIEELERELGLKNIVKLASNENPLGPSQIALDAIARASRSLTLYPDGNGFVLKKALSEALQVSPSQITLGNGSNDVLELITRAYAGPGDEIVFSQYAFAVYALSCTAVGATPVQTLAKDWGHDLDAMLAVLSERTRLVFIANPNNPTGTWLGKSEIERFLQTVPENVLVVLDEAYGEYIDHPDYPDALQYLAQYPNLILTRTFSKAWGLASLRVGYAVSHPDVANILNRVRQPFNVNALALAAASAVLQDVDYLARSRSVNTQGLAQLEQGFAALGLDFIPSLGNFISFDTGRNGQDVYQALLREGVIVRPLGPYGMPAHLRVSVGLPQENARFLEALAKVL